VHTARQARQLIADPALQVFPGHGMHCVFNPATALCQLREGNDHRATPDVEDCRPAARTSPAPTPTSPSCAPTWITSNRSSTTRWPPRPDTPATRPAPSASALSSPVTTSTRPNRSPDEHHHRRARAPRPDHRSPH
jgi:hypothetical protein